MDAEELQFSRDFDLFQKKIKAKAHAPQKPKSAKDELAYRNAENILQAFDNVKGYAYGNEINIFNSFNEWFTNRGFLTPKQLSSAKFMVDKIKKRIN